MNIGEEIIINFKEVNLGEIFISDSRYIQKKWRSAYDDLEYRYLPKKLKGFYLGESEEHYKFLIDDYKVEATWKFNSVLQQLAVVAKAFKGGVTDDGRQVVFADFFDVDDLNKLLNVKVVEGNFPEKQWRRVKPWYEREREAGARHSFRGGDEEEYYYDPEKPGRVYKNHKKVYESYHLGKNLSGGTNILRDNYYHYDFNEELDQNESLKKMLKGKYALASYVRKTNKSETINDNILLHPDDIFRDFDGIDKYGIRYVEDGKLKADLFYMKDAIYFKDGDCFFLGGYKANFKDIDAYFYTVGFRPVVYISKI